MLCLNTYNSCDLCLREEEDDTKFRKKFRVVVVVVVCVNVAVMCLDCRRARSGRFSTLPHTHAHTWVCEF